MPSPSNTPAIRRRLPPAQRRASIVEAAGRLFGERGYEATRLEDVAAAAGVTKPILYRHFSSKRDLYIALLERHRADLSSFAGVIPSEGSVEERLAAVLDVWLDYVEAHSYAWRLLFRDTGGDEEVVTYRAEVHEEARRVLAQIIKTFAGDRIPRRELMPLAELLSMGMGSLVLWWIEGANVSRAAVRAAMLRAWTGVVH
jgi:AcrR family transcriptional regulator